VIVLPNPAAPANDNFSNAVVVAGLSNSVAGTIRSATMEPGEADGTGEANGASVWWTWTAPINGDVTLDLSGTDFEATLNVYTGSSLESLSAVTNNCQQQCYSNGEGGTYCYCNGLRTSLTFRVVQGTTYQFAVGGSAPAGSLGNIILGIYETQPSLNLWQHSSLGLGTLHAAVYGNGKFIVGGDSGLIGLSLDGTNWTTESNPIGFPWHPLLARLCGWSLRGCRDFGWHCLVAGRRFLDKTCRAHAIQPLTVFCHPFNQRPFCSRRRPRNCCYLA